MKTIILIHGAWHGAWCWYKLIPLLQAKGLNVIAPEIDWDSSNAQAITKNPSRSCFNDLCNIIRQQPDPVILAGHSMGGVVISELAEAIPDFIESLVFISGFLLMNGQCVNDTEYLMSDSLIQANLKLSADKKDILVPESVIREGFYADCDIDDINLSMPRLRPQPLTSFLTPVHLSRANFGTLPRIYVECLQDRAIPLSAQRLMCKAVSCDSVISLDSSHSPFFSRPDLLAKVLTNI